jgi:hypothetical protein
VQLGLPEPAESEYHRYVNFGPPPRTPFEVELSADDIASYRENGFLVVDRLTTDEEIDWLASIYDFVFGPENEDRLVRPVDRSGVRDASKAGTITQTFHPEFRIAEILETTYVRNAKRVAAALLDSEPDELSVWTHMIRKAPGAPEVPPHQDQAFWPPDYDYASVAAWLPMHDVDVEMGAMQFLPGSHRRGVVPHRHYDDPMERLLTVDAPVDDDAFVRCPLRKGGCTFHDPATVHRTGVNTTDRPRLAFPLTVQSVPVRRAVSRAMPWQDAFLAAGGAKQTSYVADAKVLPLPT